MREAARIGMLLMVAMAAAPAFGEPIEWSHDVDAAWERTVREGRPLLLFRQTTPTHTKRQKSTTT